MDSNDSTRSNAPEEIIVLGVASIETKGAAPAGNEGLGHQAMPGITE